MNHATMLDSRLPGSALDERETESSVHAQVTVADVVSRGDVTFTSNHAMILVERYGRDDSRTDRDEALALLNVRWPWSRPVAARFVALEESGPGSAQFAAPRASIADLTCRNCGLAGCAACL
jgi:hypothetical protein